MQTRSGLFAELTGSLSLTSVPLTNSSQSLSPSEVATVDLAQPSSTSSAAVNIAQPRSISPISFLISPSLVTADLTLRLPLISPSSLSSLSAFHSASLWLWVFLFVCLFVCLFVAIWVDLILVSNCGGCGLIVVVGLQ